MMNQTLLNTPAHMFAKPTPASKNLSLADWALIKAVERFDLSAVQQALNDGGRPTVRKPYRGLTGEPLTLMAVRHGQAPLLQTLLKAGAPIDEGLAMAAALLTERVTRDGHPEQVLEAQAIVDLLESSGIDWGVCDRAIGGGLRAIDLLAAAQPEWAQQPARRQGLEPQRPSFAHPTNPQSAGRTRRQSS